MKKSKSFNNLIFTIITYLILIAAVLSILYPLSAIFLSSFKTMKDFMGNPLGVPRSFTYENYLTAWNKMNFSKYTFNSVYITFITVATVSVFSSMAGYKLSRDFKGSKWIYLYFLVGMSIPTQSFIITLFSYLKTLHLISTYTGMILTYTSISLPLAIFLFAAFYRTLPYELIEASKIDGCNEIRLFIRILFPLSRPAFATVVITTSMSVWNDFFVQMIINMDKEKYTLPMGLLKFRGETSVNWTPLFSSIILVAVPIVLLFIVLQKQFIKGLTSGAVKG